jgi:hypothetical protein
MEDVTRPTQALMEGNRGLLSFRRVYVNRTSTTGGTSPSQDREMKTMSRNPVFYLHRCSALILVHVSLPSLPMA